MKINKKIRKIKRQYGFTLIELLTVISIISLISSITVVTVRNTRIKGRDTTRRQLANTLISAINLYYQEKGTYPVGQDDTGALNWGADYSSWNNDFIPPLKNEGFTNQTIHDPAEADGWSYQYKWRNGNNSNSQFLALDCGWGPPQAKASLWITPESGAGFTDLPINNNYPNINIICFY